MKKHISTFLKILKTKIAHMCIKLKLSHINFCKWNKCWLSLIKWECHNLSFKTNVVELPFSKFLLCFRKGFGVPRFQRSALPNRKVIQLLRFWEPAWLGSENRLHIHMHTTYFLVQYWKNIEKMMSFVTICIFHCCFRNKRFSAWSFISLCGSFVNFLSKISSQSFEQPKAASTIKLPVVF
jgi:hypothetical protein